MPVTLAVFAVTAALSTAQVVWPAVLDALARTPAARDGEPWRLVTALIVQDGGLAGTLSNLAFLLVLGALAERVLRRAGGRPGAGRVPRRPRRRPAGRVRDRGRRYGVAASCARIRDRSNTSVTTNPRTSATSTPRLANAQAPSLPPRPSGPSR
jgi:hypothetical protein